MSNSPLALLPEKNDVVCDSPNQEKETLDLSDPKNDLVAEPEENTLEEEYEEADEGQEPEASIVSSGMVEQEALDPDISTAEVVLTSPSRSARKSTVRRKKGKWKGKQLQAIEEKLQTLTGNLNPIPFIPLKIPDFSKHEKLFRKLGLWDFVHVDFDRNIRVDLIAQLVLSYKPKMRASYVNDLRVLVNRADLARAFHLPLKKEKGSGGAVEVDLDSEVLSDDSIGFIVEFVNDWLLLHEDTWMTPNEVMEWLRLIKDGHPEKVDWAGLFWFMVEKELKQGTHLTNCYYASHLQHLIKVQRVELFLSEEPSANAMELDPSIKEEEDEDEVNQEDSKAIDPMERPEYGEHVGIGPSTELTLGQDGKEEDINIMYGEAYKDSAEDQGGVEREEVEEEQGQWLLDKKNNMQEHYLLHCSTENPMEFQNFEDGDEEDEVEDEEEEEEDHEFHTFPNEDALEGVGFAGNLLQAMEANQMALSSQDQLQNQSSIDIRADLQQISSVPPFINNSGKRVMEQENRIFHHHEGNKRLRIDDSWDNTPMDSAMCLEKIQEMVDRAKKYLQEEKEQALEQSNMNQQILLSELQKRDNVIEHLHKARLEEIQKKDGEIYRLERELFFMKSVLDGYKRSLKETQKMFAEYRERAQLPEESTYKDAGPGGVMLTAAELEKLQQKQEEEFRMNCLIVEQRIKEEEEEYVNQFSGYYEKIDLLNNRLEGVEVAYKELIYINAGRKCAVSEVVGVDEVSEALQNPESEVVTEFGVAGPEEGFFVAKAEGEVLFAESEEGVLVAVAESSPIMEEELAVTEEASQMGEVLEFTMPLQDEVAEAEGEVLSALAEEELTFTEDASLIGEVLEEFAMPLQDEVAKAEGEVLFAVAEEELTVTKEASQMGEEVLEFTMSPRDEAAKAEGDWESGTVMEEELQLTEEGRVECT